MTSKREIVDLTALLRNSTHPMWARLRQLLLEHGVAVETAILATSFPDDTSFEFGVVVTNDRRVYQFGLDYLHKPVEQGSFTEWVDPVGLRGVVPLDECDSYIGGCTDCWPRAQVVSR